MLRKRAIKISVRLNEQEHEHLKKQAAISGYPMEPFIRALIMGVNLRPRPPDEYAEIRRQLAAIGNNINQLARKANAGFASRDEVTRALRMLDRVYELMYQLSQQSWQ